MSFRTLDRVNNFLNSNDARSLARRRLPTSAFDFIDGGALDEWTVRRNETALQQWTFEPHFMTGVGAPDTRVTVLGEQVELPYLMAPAGLATLVHPEGELAAARAAGQAGTIFVSSTASGYSIEEIADASTGPTWFQLYLWRDPLLVQSLIHRAAAAGCSALVVTVDVPIVGTRERDLRNGMNLGVNASLRSLTEAVRRPRWFLGQRVGRGAQFGNLVGLAGDRGVRSIGEYVNNHLVNPNATWDDVRSVRRAWDGPLIVKGILTVQDARAALNAGADALYVSNHGGRQLDYSRGTFDVLPEIVEEFGDSAEILIDGGVRRGSDVVKARALGATAALAGRPWMFALSAGEPGVSALLRTIREETRSTLALLGRANFSELSASAVRHV